MEDCQVLIGIVMAEPSRFLTWYLVVDHLPFTSGSTILEALTSLFGLVSDPGGVDFIEVARPRCSATSW